MSDMQYKEALDYQNGANCARSKINAGLSIKQLRNTPLGKNHSEAFENGYYDELYFQDKKKS